MVERDSTSNLWGAEGAVGGPPTVARGPRALPGFFGHARGTTRAWAALGLSAALVTLGVSCGKEASERSGTVGADSVRGEPINAPVATNTRATAETVAAARPEGPAQTPAALVA